MYNVADMDAKALVAAARTDTSSAAQVVRLRAGLPPKTPNRLAMLFLLLLLFGFAALVLTPPHGPLFADSPVFEVGLLVFLGLLVVGASFALVAKIGPPDERLLFGAWYLRRAFATADERLMPPIEQSAQDALPQAQCHPQVLWLDDLSLVRDVKRFIRWFDAMTFLPVVLALAWFIKPCFVLPLGAVCQPPGPLSLVPYTLWIGGIGVRYLKRGSLVHSSVAVADVAGFRLELGRGHERLIGWSEVRSLTRLTFRTVATYASHYLYVLDTGDMTLAWGYNIIVTGGLRSLFPRNRPEDEQLAMAIATYSNIPMREGSALLQVVASAAKETFSPNWPKLLAPLKSALPVQAPPQILAAMDVVSPHPRLEKRDILALIAPLMYVAFCIVGWRMWN